MNTSNSPQNVFERIINLFRPGAAPLTPPAPVTRKVSLLILNPVINSEGGRRLTQILGWNDPDALVTDFIGAMRSASYGYANYEIAERFLVDDFLPLVDGFTYTDEEFMRCWRAQSGFHKPDGIDYDKLIAPYDVLNKVRSGAIDEVWAMGFPYAGFYESRMGGPGAFWCNAPPMANTDSALRRFVIMGFNYERSVGEMIHSYGHRSESIMEQVHRRIPDVINLNLWKRYIRYDMVNPGRAEVGTIHFAPNSVKDYELGSTKKVSSHSHAWLSFPSLSEPPRLEDCGEWGNGDTRAHDYWWHQHLPHVGGTTLGIDNNWWKYIVDPNTVG